MLCVHPTAIQRTHPAPTPPSRPPAPGARRLTCHGANVLPNVSGSRTLPVRSVGPLLATTSHVSMRDQMERDTTPSQI